MCDWIKLGDRFPEEKTPVLVTWVGINGKTHSDDIAAIIDGKWYWWDLNVHDTLEFDNKCSAFIQITHWIPLPPPPGGEQ